MDWLKYWEQKAGESELSSMDRSGYSIKEFLIYTNSINQAFNGFLMMMLFLILEEEQDIPNMAFHPFVKAIYLADFSAKMIENEV